MSNETNNNYVGVCSDQLAQLQADEARLRNKEKVNLLFIHMSTTYIYCLQWFYYIV